MSRDSKELFVQRFLKVLIKTQSTWRREIKKQTHQLTLLFMVGLSDAATFSIRKLFLKILQYPQETPVLDSIFKKRDPDPDIFNTNYFEKHLQMAAF